MNVHDILFFLELLATLQCCRHKTSRTGLFRLYLISMSTHALFSLVLLLLHFDLNLCFEPFWFVIALLHVLQAHWQSLVQMSQGHQHSMRAYVST